MEPKAKKNRPVLRGKQVCLLARDYSHLLTISPFYNGLWEEVGGVWRQGWGLGPPVGETWAHAALTKARCLTVVQTIWMLAKASLFNSTNSHRGWLPSGQMSGPIRATGSSQALLLNFSPIRLFGIWHHVYLGGNRVWHFASPCSGWGFLSDLVRGFTSWPI